MIPAPFQYVRAESTAEALAALAEHGDEAKLLAGGHSLLPLMKLRFATPEVLVDIARIRDLRYVRDGGDHVAVGALTRHRDLERDPLVRAQAPLLGHTARLVGDPQVRNRGTIGGSLSHGDPAADLPAVVLAMRGTLVVEGPRGRREILADDFWTGFLETAVEADEMVVEVRLPKMGDVGWSYQKFTRRAHDWAIVGVAAVGGDRPGVALVNMGSTPLRAAPVEELVARGAPQDEAAAVAAEGADPPSDLGADSDFRQHLAQVLVQRALVEVAGR